MLPIMILHRYLGPFDIRALILSVGTVFDQPMGNSDIQGFRNCFKGRFGRMRGTERVRVSGLRFKVFRVQGFRV